MASKIRFMSCFICEVAVDDECIELVDSAHRAFYIDKNDKDAMSDFKSWFKDVYKACVPQTLTVVQYELERDHETNGLKMKVVKLIYKKDKPAAMLNESKESAQ